MNERESHLINLIAERDAEIERLKDALKAKGTPGAAVRIAKRYGITPHEARFMEILSDGQIWSFRSIARRMAGYGDPPSPETIKVTLSHIRAKLRQRSTKIDIVHVRGCGYQITDGLDELRAAMKPPVQSLAAVDDERLR